MFYKKMTGIMIKINIATDQDHSFFSVIVNKGKSFQTLDIRK
jgi:hypothetical protein